ncbi:MAG: acyl CoA:acetate/3-ketoacid CoA transferase [Burkholderiales bacterium]|nr:acyl CoA:acetate/3-ketoacid CoA transferase [Burkholderiales bacterium]
MSHGRGNVRLKKIIEVEDAVAVIHSGDVIASAGYGGNGTPDQLFVALEKRFLETGTPRDLTLVFAGGQGDMKDKGLNRLGHAGLLKRVIGGHFGLIPRIEKLAVANEIEAYNLPEGILTHLYRDIGAGKPGTLSPVGLGTYIDPRHGGGRMNAMTTEDIVRLIEIDGEEFLFFKSFPIKVALIRGTTADPDGNITAEREALTLENLALAIAARNSGGIVLAQVERIAAEGSLDARRVQVPGVLVDCVVLAEPEHHMQTYGTQFSPAFAGELRVPQKKAQAAELNERKIIARRAALELSPNCVINVGVGTVPDQVPLVADEERVQDLITLTVDPGIMGGVPMSGLDFGAAVNYQAVIDHCSEFDFIDGGGLDAAFLGFGECDAGGNINASRFGKRIPGCGGFINISQNAKKIVFVGTFTSGGLEVKIENGGMRIAKEGKFAKFVRSVDQTTFSAAYAQRRGQDVLYVTERCVFRLGEEGLTLTEIAPGVDLERDVLAHMPFRPAIEGPRLMDAAIFKPGPMGLRESMLDINIEDRLSYDAASNTVYMNYAGMRIRDEADIRAIVGAVDALLAPLGRRVHSVVNYERFSCDEDVFSKYVDAVEYVEAAYYLDVKRYTSGAFLRHKLGSELAKRDITAEVLDSHKVAKQRTA